MCVPSQGTSDLMGHKFSISVPNVCLPHAEAAHKHCDSGSQPCCLFPLRFVGWCPADVPHIFQCTFSVCRCLSQNSQHPQPKIRHRWQGILPCPLSHPSYINPCASKKSYHSWLNSTQTHILPLHNCPAWQGQLGSTPWPRSDI